MSFILSSTKNLEGCVCLACLGKYAVRVAEPESEGIAYIWVLSAAARQSDRGHLDIDPPPTPGGGVIRREDASLQGVTMTRLSIQIEARSI